MIVSGGAGILVCRKRARKMRMDDSNSVGNMAMSKKCNVGKITQKQGKGDKTKCDKLSYSA